MRLNKNDKILLDEVKLLITNNPSENYTIGQLAAKAYMNTTKFKRVFHRYTKTTVHNFILTVKMQHAGNLLEEDSKSLSEIAAATGFSSLSNFIRAFRKYYEDTPGHRRKRL